MTVDVKNLVCENCEERLVEVGISQLYDMIWKQHPKTKRFNFYYAEVSERKDGSMICINCGEEVDEGILELFSIQDPKGDSEGEYSMSLSDDELESIPTECEHCGDSFADVGVFQLWDVDWMWNKKEQRFTFHQAYASELDDYSICCNGCGREIEEELPLELVKMRG